MGVSGWGDAKELGGVSSESEKGRTKADSSSAQRFFFPFHLHWMEQYPGASLRLHLVIVITIGVFLSLDATVGAPLSSIVIQDACSNSSTSVHERRRCRRGGRLLLFPVACYDSRWCVSG